MNEHSQKNSFEQDLSIEDVLASQQLTTDHEKAASVHKSRLSPKAERYTLIGFFVIGVSVLVLGMVQFSQGRIIGWDSVFGYNSEDELPEQQKMLAGDEYIEALNDRTLDTDSDTLPDYDELNVYGTSPYLADSDSDGIDDNDELKQGTNPNCPEGQDCGGFVLDAELYDTIGQDAAIFSNLPDFDVTSSAGSNLNTQLLQGTVDATQLRIILEQNGAPAETLNAIDDATLVELYQQVLAENPGLTQVNTPGTVPEPGQNELSSLQDLTPTEIRSLMISNGADPNIINQLSDDELQSLYNETLQNLLESSGN